MRLLVVFLFVNIVSWSRIYLIFLLLVSRELRGLYTFVSVIIMLLCFVFKSLVWLNMMKMIWIIRIGERIVMEHVIVWRIYFFSHILGSWRLIFLIYWLSITIYTIWLVFISCFILLWLVSLIVASTHIIFVRRNF